jgi:hypothetical protein
MTDIVYKLLGRDPKCFTGGDCWNYDYSNRWLLLLAIISGIGITYRLIKRYIDQDKLHESISQIEQDRS